MLWSAEVMHLVARRAAEYGVEIDGTVRFNLQRAVQRKDTIVQGILEGIYSGLRGKEAIIFLRDEARFLNDHEIDTGEGRLSFARAIIATGARNAVPLIEGLDQIDYLTNRTALHLQEFPRCMVIVGGGYVGIEFAQMYERFGTEVTLLGRNPQLAPDEEPNLASLLAGYLREEGIDVRTGTPVTRVRQEGAEKVVTALADGTETDFRADEVLIATGRVGNTDELNLEAAGVDIAPTGGFVRVDDELRTS